MSINHNRIKVSDLEKDLPNKILTTNASGELEFNEIYNALDCAVEGQVLDARQGKELKDLIDNISSLLVSDNLNLDTIQELAEAVETIQTSISTILVNDLTTGGITQALTAEMGKTLKGFIDNLAILVNNHLLDNEAHQDLFDAKVDKELGKSLLSDTEISRLATLSNYIHPLNHPASIIVQDSENRFVTDAEKAAWDNKQSALNGTGFVKTNGTTISYDNSIYLTNIGGITAGGELSGTYPNPTLSNNAVIGKTLTGLNITGSTITASDSILAAFGKLQNQVNSLIGSSIYQGVWNASTNSPSLTSGVGTKGNYYKVSVAGSTNIDGITDWNIGDWVIFNGTTWDKVDNTDSVSSVNGYTGSVNLTTSNVPEGTGLYYTEARVSANSSVAANTVARHVAVTLGTTNGLSLSGQQLSLGLASTSTTGTLSSTDWNNFNNKQSSLSGTGIVKSTNGTISYLIDNSSNWNTAYSWGNHAGLYPSLLGGGASGTWNINITGNASSTISSYSLVSSGMSMVEQSGDSLIKYYHNVLNSEVGLFSSNDNSNSILTLNRHPGNYYSQLGFSSDSNMYYRSFTAETINTTKAWRRVLDSDNYTLYAPSLTGIGASGTWGINITGNANTVGNVDISRIVYGSNASKIGSHADANSWRNSGFYENEGGGSNWPTSTWYNSINVRHSNQGNYHGFQAAMSYYDNKFWFRSYQGNGTFQNWEYALSNVNYNLFAPTLTGTGASGTWGISITGSASNLNGYYTSISSTENTIALRDSAGDIAVRELVVTSGIHTGDIPIALMGVYASTNQVVKYSADMVASFLNGSAINRWYDGWVNNPGYDANTIGGSKSGFTYANNAIYNGPLVHFDAGGYGLQLNAPYASGGDNIVFRTRNGDSGTWNSWKSILTSVDYQNYTYFVNGLSIGTAGVRTGNLAISSAIAIGDSDTGFKQNGDGVLETYANNVRVKTDLSSGTYYDVRLGSSRVYSGYDSGVANSISCSNWFRTSSATGWYNDTYGGGIYMADSSYVRIYNNKAFLVNNTIRVETASDSKTTYYVASNGGRTANVGIIDGANMYVSAATNGNLYLGSGTTTFVDGILSVNSSVTATAFYQSSDIRLKELVEYKPKKVSSIESISYKWKDKKDDKVHIGYSAQEVQKVLPDAVSKDEKGMLSVDYIQVLVAKIALLEARINELENK